MIGRAIGGCATDGRANGGRLNGGGLKSSFGVRIVQLAVLTAIVIGSGDGRADKDDVSAPNKGLAVLPDSSLLDRVFVPDRRQQRLLERAKKSIAERDHLAALAFLRQILDQPVTQYVGVRPDGTPIGIHDSVRDLLINAPPQLQRAWNASQSGIARKSLRDALNSGDLSLLHEVSQRFPLTEPALDALLAEALLLRQQGRHRQGLGALAEAESWLVTNLGPRRRRAMIRELRTLWESDGHSVGNTRPTEERPVDRKVMTPALPVAKPVWLRTDSPWHYAGAPSVMPPEESGNHDALIIGVTRPLLIDDAVIVRTVAGVVCLERATGAVRWQVESPVVSGYLSKFWMGDYDDKSNDAGMMVFGCPVARNHTVWFLEHLVDADDVPDELQLFGRFPVGPVVNRRGGYVLTSVSVKKGPPAIWRTGTLPIADARGLAPGRGVPEGQAPGGDGWVEEPRLHDHLFISAPAIHEHTLLIISEHRDSAWLNSFSAATGRLLWQRPLGVIDSFPDEGRNPWDIDEEKMQSAAVLGVVGDIVVCVQSNGLAVGCRFHDGAMQWARSLTLPEESRDWDYSDELIMEDERNEPSKLWLRSDDSRVYCGRGTSRQMFCLDAATGRIDWTVVRAVDGKTSGDRCDSAIVGMTANELIFAGQHHCRAVRKKDGGQAWVAEIGTMIGFPVCLDNQCLVPIRRDRVLAIDLESGGVTRISRSFPEIHRVSLAADHRGLVAAASWRVAAWVWDDESLRTNPELRKPLTSDDIDARLDSVARHCVRNINGFSRMPVWSPEHTRADCRNDLRTATLSDSQRLRWSVLDPDLRGHEDIILRQFKEDPQQLVEILPGWSVRLLQAVRMTGRPGLAQHFVAEELRHEPVRTGVLDEVLLQPDLAGDVREQLVLADRLMADGRQAEAELLVLNMPRVRNRLSSDVRQRLLQIRRPFMRADALPADPARISTVVIQSEPLSPGANRIVEEFLPHREISRTAVSLPEWHRQTYRDIVMSDTSGIQRVMIDPGRETFVGVTGPVGRKERYTDRRWAVDQPTLVSGFASDATHMTAISALNDGLPSLLWKQPVLSAAADTAHVVTSSGILINEGDRFRCLHPLTGRTLWIVDLAGSEEWNFLTASLEYDVIGDSHFALQSSTERYGVLRAADGAVLRHGTFPGPRIDASGRRLCGLSQDKEQLQIHDLVTGEEIIPEGLEDKTIVTVEGYAALPPGHLFVETDASELLIFDYIMNRVDTRIPFDHPTEPLDKSWDSIDVFRRHGRIFVSLDTYSEMQVDSAPMNDRRLGAAGIVCLDENTLQPLWRLRRPAAFLANIFGDPCPVMVLWQHSVSENERPRARSLFGGIAEPAPKLSVTLLDVQTGRVVAERTGLPAGIPVSCIHDAEEQTIRMTTDQSVIRMRYTK